MDLETQFLRTMLLQQVRETAELIVRFRSAHGPRALVKFIERVPPEGLTWGSIASRLLRHADDLERLGLRRFAARARAMALGDGSPLRRAVVALK